MRMRLLASSIIIGHNFVYYNSAQCQEHDLKAFSPKVSVIGFFIELKYWMLLQHDKRRLTVSTFFTYPLSGEQEILPISYPNILVC